MRRNAPQQAASYLLLLFCAVFPLCAINRLARVHKIGSYASILSLKQR